VFLKEKLTAKSVVEACRQVDNREGNGHFPLEGMISRMLESGVMDPCAEFASLEPVLSGAFGRDESSLRKQKAAVGKMQFMRDNSVGEMGREPMRVKLFELKVIVSIGSSLRSLFCGTADVAVKRLAQCLRTNVGGDPGDPNTVTYQGVTVTIPSPEEILMHLTDEISAHEVSSDDPEKERKRVMKRDARRQGMIDRIRSKAMVTTSIAHSLLALYKQVFRYSLLFPEGPKERMDAQENEVIGLMKEMFGKYYHMLQIVRDDEDRTITVSGGPLDKQTYIFCLVKSENRYSERITLDGERAMLTVFPVADGTRGKQTPMSITDMQGRKRHCGVQRAGARAAGNRFVGMEWLSGTISQHHPFDLVYRDEFGKLVVVEVKTTLGRHPFKIPEGEGRVRTGIERGAKDAIGLGARYELVVLAKSRDGRGLWKAVTYDHNAILHGIEQTVEEEAERAWKVNGVIPDVPLWRPEYLKNDPAGENDDPSSRNANTDVPLRTGQRPTDVSDFFTKEEKNMGRKEAATYDYLLRQGDQMTDILTKYAPIIRSEMPVKRTLAETRDIMAKECSVAKTPDSMCSPMTVVQNAMVYDDKHIPGKILEARTKQHLTLGFPVVETYSTSTGKADAFRKMTENLLSPVDGNPAKVGGTGRIEIEASNPIFKSLADSLERGAGGGMFAPQSENDGPYKAIEIGPNRVRITVKRESKSKSVYKRTDITTEERNAVIWMMRLFGTSGSKPEVGIRSLPAAHYEVDGKVYGDAGYTVEAVKLFDTFFTTSRHRVSGPGVIKNLIGHYVEQVPIWATNNDKEIFKAGKALGDENSQIPGRAQELATYLFMREIEAAAQEDSPKRNEITSQVQFGVIDHPLGGMRAYVRSDPRAAHITMVVHYHIRTEDRKIWEILAGPRLTRMPREKHIIWTSTETCMMSSGLLHVDKQNFNTQIALHSNTLLESLLLTPLSSSATRKAEPVFSDIGNAFEAHLLLATMNMGSLADGGYGVNAIKYHLSTNSQIQTKIATQWVDPLTFYVMVKGDMARYEYVQKIKARRDAKPGDTGFHPPFLYHIRNDEAPNTDFRSAGRQDSGSAYQVRGSGALFYLSEVLEKTMGDEGTSYWEVPALMTVSESQYQSLKRIFSWIEGAGDPNSDFPLVDSVPAAPLLAIKLERGVVNHFNIARACRIFHKAPLVARVVSVLKKLCNFSQARTSFKVSQMNVIDDAVKLVLPQMRAWFEKQAGSGETSWKALPKVEMIMRVSGPTKEHVSRLLGDKYLDVIATWPVDKDGVMIEQLDLESWRTKREFPLGLIHSLKYGPWVHRPDAAQKIVSEWSTDAALHWADETGEGETKPFAHGMYYRNLVRPLEKRTLPLGTGSSIMYAHSYMKRGMAHWDTIGETRTAFTEGSALESIMKGTTPSLTTTSSAVNEKGQDTVAGVVIADVMQKAKILYGDTSLRSLLLITGNQLLEFYTEFKYTIPLVRCHKIGDMKRNRWFVYKFLYYTLLALTTNLSPLIEPIRINTAKSSTNLEQAKEFLQTYREMCGSMDLPSLGMFGSVEDLVQEKMVSEIGFNPFDEGVMELGSAIVEGDGEKFRQAHFVPGILVLSRLLGQKFGAGLINFFEAAVSRNVTFGAECIPNFLKKYHLLGIELKARGPDGDDVVVVSPDPRKADWDQKFLSATKVLPKDINSLVNPETGRLVLPSSQGFEEGDMNDLAGCAVVGASDVARDAALLCVDDTKKFFSYLSRNGTIQPLAADIAGNGGATQRSACKVSVTVTGDDAIASLVGVSKTEREHINVDPADREKLCGSSTENINFAHLFVSYWSALCGAGGFPLAAGKWRIGVWEGVTGGVKITLGNRDSCCRELTKFFSSLPAHTGKKSEFIAALYQHAVGMIRMGAPCDVAQAWATEMIGCYVASSFGKLNDVVAITQDNPEFPVISTDNFLPPHMVPILNAQGASASQMHVIQKAHECLAPGTVGDRVLALFETGRDVYQPTKRVVGLRNFDEGIIRDRDERLSKHLARLPPAVAMSMLNEQVVAPKVVRALGGGGKLTIEKCLKLYHTKTYIRAGSLTVGSKSLGFLIRAAATDNAIRSHEGLVYGMLENPRPMAKPLTVPPIVESIYKLAEYRRLNNFVIAPRGECISYEMGPLNSRKIVRASSAVSAYVLGDEAYYEKSIGSFDADDLNGGEADDMLEGGVDPTAQSHMLQDKVSSCVVLGVPGSEFDRPSICTRSQVYLFPSTNIRRKYHERSSAIDVLDLYSTLLAITSVKELVNYLLVARISTRGASPNHILGKMLNGLSVRKGEGPWNTDIDLMKSLSGDSMIFSCLVRKKNGVVHEERYYRVTSKGLRACIGIARIGRLVDGVAEFTSSIIRLYSEGAKAEEKLILYHGFEIAGLQAITTKYDGNESIFEYPGTVQHGNLGRVQRLVINSPKGQLYAPVWKETKDFMPHNLRSMIVSKTVAPSTMSYEGHLVVNIPLYRKGMAAEEMEASLMVFPKRGFKDAYHGDTHDIKISWEREYKGKIVKTYWLKTIVAAPIELSDDILPHPNSVQGLDPVLVFVPRHSNQTVASDYRRTY